MALGCVRAGEVADEEPFAFVGVDVGVDAEDSLHVQSFAGIEHFEAVAPVESVQAECGRQLPVQDDVVAGEVSLRTAQEQ